MNPIELGVLPNLLERQAAWVGDYHLQLRVSEQGAVVSVGDGIAWISGLPSASMDEVLLLDDGSQALVFDLNQGLLGAILLRDTDRLTSGTLVRRVGQPLSIPVGEGLLGRVVDPLGLPLDGLPPLAPNGHQRLEGDSPAIIARDFVQRPLYTGIKIVDALVPIGKGQRQLIIGDEGLGRSALGIDAVINQRGQNVACIYVLIGQKRSTVVNTIQLLREHGSLEYTCIVVAEASALPGLKHLAPYAGCAIAEYWMERGRDTLVVYDDLSTHARTYRELSLLLRRPPGREAYPGDIFSIHAGLLERSTCLNAAHGGGSMTALPIVETQQGDIASYIPTNLISITDGQIYLDSNLFAAGFRPAIDIARSVSRIGGRAQHPAIKAEAGRMKLDYLQFLELEVFTRFGTKLDAAMESPLRRGRLLREILKQDRLAPLRIEHQMAWLVAFNDGLFDTTEPEKISEVLEQLYRQITECELELEDGREEWGRTVLEFIQAWQTSSHGKT
ncbi:MAG: F0F1 ATP synthase subunit alpha [Candidatus Methylumidiphilus alinenensis]|uniref:ATP synthase subunit alpha n=1 Tax=Candidatus Methylumidiphilus alinenensis TaxID=2202197 RepID=A0A2W4S559_9GAMM|nr:MAG: F0F1 ATP synthase subunit alpha [Candidatus Methylumidiphilus alinenensis]